MNPLASFTLNLYELRPVGHDLRQPESVLVAPDGTLWVSDLRAIATRIAPDGTQTLLGQPIGEPNGLALDRAGNLYVANLAGGLYRLSPDGDQQRLLGELDGQPLGAVNFPWLDRQDRLWLSVTTRRTPWFQAAADPQPDGYIVLLDRYGPRIVADGFYATNEIRLDADEQYLYVAETMACRILRFPVRPDGSLGEREVFGPDPLGPGAYVDGIAFDTGGNLWVATVLRNGLYLLTPDGEPHCVFEDPQPAALDHFVAQVAAGTLRPADFTALAGNTVQFPTSIAFGGPDRRTVYLGTLAMPHLLSFRAPLPGLPLRHWP